MNRKKFLLILIIIFLVVAALLVGGYFYLTNTRYTEKAPNNEVTGSLAEIGDQNLPLADSDDMVGTGAGNIPKLRHLTTAPVAGYDFVDTSKGFVIWYVERASGHVFQAATSTLDIVRVTNTTIPRVYEAHIGKGGGNVILRTLSETGERIQTFIGSPKVRVTSSTSTDSTKELSGIFTSDTVAALSLSPSKDRFFGMTGSQTGIGNIYTFAAKSTNAFSNPLKKWVPQWVSANSIIMTSAPSAKTLNISYLLNPTTKAFTKLMGPKNGLVVSSSPAVNKLLYSENKGNALSFGIYDIKTGVESVIDSGTIPDKCVWSKKDTSLAYCGFPKNLVAGAYPDDWYQGKVLFNDTLRTLDTNTFRFNTISDLESAARTQIDATNLMLSSDEKYLLFTNKADLTLWMLELEN